MKSHRISRELVLGEWKYLHQKRVYILNLNSDTEEISYYTKKQNMFLLESNALHPEAILCLNLRAFFSIRGIRLHRLPEKKNNGSNKRQRTQTSTLPTSTQIRKTYGKPATSTPQPA